MRPKSLDSHRFTESEEDEGEDSDDEGNEVACPLLEDDQPESARQYDDPDECQSGDLACRLLVEGVTWATGIGEIKLGGEDGSKQGEEECQDSDPGEDV